MNSRRHREQDEQDHEDEERQVAIRVAEHLARLRRQQHREEPAAVEPGNGRRWNTKRDAFVYANVVRPQALRPRATRPDHEPAAIASASDAAGPAIEATTTSRGYRRKLFGSIGAGFAYAAGISSRRTVHRIAISAGTKPLPNGSNHCFGRNEMLPHRRGVESPSPRPPAPGCTRGASSRRTARRACRPRA